MSTVYRLTFADDDFIDYDGFADDLAASIQRHFDVDVASVEDITPVELRDVVIGGESYIGAAHIRLNDGDLYAACPMTRSNLPLLEKWLKDNHAALAKE